MCNPRENRRETQLRYLEQGKKRSCLQERTVESRTVKVARNEVAKQKDMIEQGTFMAKWYVAAHGREPE